MTSIIEHLMKMLIAQCVRKPEKCAKRDEKNKRYKGIVSWTVNAAICGWLAPEPAMDPFIEAMKVLFYSSNLRIFNIHLK
mgnify:CR=1 FL=1